MRELGEESGKRAVHVKHLLFQLRDTKLFDMRNGADRSVANRMRTL